MRHLLLPVTIAFLIGLSVGGLAFGKKGEPAAPTAAPDSPTAAAAGELQSEASRTAPELDATAASERSAATGTSEASGPVTVDIGPMSLEEQLEVVIARWAGMENRIAQLGARVASLEQRALDGGAGRSADTTNGSDGAAAALPTDTPEDRRLALISAGVAEERADDIVWRQSELELERLELQDRALREGWFQTERYFNELRSLNTRALDLRAELGESVYDDYLYQTGEDNRVKVRSVIEGSAGYQSGLLPGDIIESYAGERIFTFSDLRNATTTGERDEVVPVLVRRDGLVFETWMARGPIGIRLDSANVAPDT